MGPSEKLLQDAEMLPLSLRALQWPGEQASPFSPSRLLAVLAFFHNRIQRIQDSFQVSLRFDFRDFLLKRKEERAIVIPDNSIC